MKGGKAEVISMNRTTSGKVVQGMGLGYVGKGGICSSFAWQENNLDKLSYCSNRSNHQPFFKKNSKRHVFNLFSGWMSSSLQETTSLKLSILMLSCSWCLSCRYYLIIYDQYHVSRLHQTKGSAQSSWDEKILSSLFIHCSSDSTGRY